MSRAQSGVRVVGDEEAKRYLKQLGESTRSANGKVVQVGSPLQYAYGIETGRHRSGRLARRAGGVFYLTRALESVQGQIKKRIASSITKGSDGVFDEMKRIGLDVERKAKDLVVRVSGTLQRSIQTIYPGRPVTTGGLSLGVGSRTRRPR